MPGLQSNVLQASSERNFDTVFQACSKCKVDGLEIGGEPLDFFWPSADPPDCALAIFKKFWAISAIQSLAAVERSKTRLSRDFPSRSNFDFCNSICQ
jgi:hypothetical protein